MTPKAAPPATNATPEAPARPDTALMLSFRAARRVSTPLVAVETPDPAATIATIRQVLNGESPTIQWDIARGLRPLNATGGAALITMSGTDAALLRTEDQKRMALKDIASSTVNPVEALGFLERLPQYGACFMHNAHRQLADAQVVQAIWNLRDQFKANRRTLIMLGPGFRLPAELSGDVIVLDEPLPTRDELGSVVDSLHRAVQLDPPAGDARVATLDAIVGLSAYTAEAVTALSLTPAGVDNSKLWDRKIKAIENCDGLSVWKPRYAGESSLAHMKGVDNAVAFMRQLIDAKAFGAIAFIDEGDKALAGGMSDYSGDSGVAKDQVGQVLSYMSDNNSIGVLFAGFAGAGKTELAKATAATSGKPLIVFDLGGMKGGVVGQSEAAIRQNLKMLTATAEGRVLFIMTANRTTQFTPEMNRRFPDQYFFDQPDAAARLALWQVYGTKNALESWQMETPAGWSDEGWTGAEIRRACERAAMFKQSIAQASQFIIPQCVSARAVLRDLREQASGRFLSASRPGLYEMPTDVEQREASVLEATNARFLTVQ